MTTIAWDTIRRELAAAVVLVQFETADGHDSPRLRSRAADHIRTALLLISGSSAAQIIGHVPGSDHAEGEAIIHDGQD